MTRFCNLFFSKTAVHPLVNTINNTMGTAFDSIMQYATQIMSCLSPKKWVAQQLCRYKEGGHNSKINNLLTIREAFLYTFDSRLSSLIQK